jgi:hypothetical protein
MPRKTQRAAGTVVLACLAVAAALVGVNVLTSERESAGADQPQAPPATTAARATPAAAPVGWRWEAYENIQVRVPTDWATSFWAGGGRCGPFREPEPIVRRPGGAVPAILRPCPKPPTPLHDAPSVEFDGAKKAGVIRYDDGWTKETRLVGGGYLTVTTGDEALRQQIFDSAGPIETIDGNGCEPAPALASNLVLRPPSQGGLGSVGAVESVSVCRYSTGVSKDDPWPLEATSRILDAAAGKLVDDLVAAPAGSGPNITDPRICGSDPGNEVIVLRAHGSEHDQDVIVRYEGCKRNGTDDGSVARQLTSSAAKQIFSGVHEPDGMNRTLYQLLVGPPPPVF